MGLFDDLLGKASELTGIGQDAADAASQAAGDLGAQAEEHITGLTEHLPQDPADIAESLFGGENEQK